MIAPMSQRFVDAMERFAETEGVDLVTFEKGQRKDDLAQAYLAAFDRDEGVLFIGKAQEKASVFRTDKRRDAAGKTYPWINRATAMPDHYYVYILDRDFGPLFIKFCSYFPYAAKLCLNGHEWLKRQLTAAGSPSNRWTTGFRRATRRHVSSGSPTISTRPRSTRSSGSGSAACRIPSRPPTERPTIGITSPFSKPSLP